MIAGVNYLGYWRFKFYFLGLIFNGDSLVDHLSLQLRVIRFLRLIYYYKHLCSGIMRLLTADGGFSCRIGWG